MKFNKTAVLGWVLLTSTALAAGRIQNEDVKSLAELTAAGGSSSQLINDSKLFVSANTLNKQLSAALVSGEIGNSLVPMLIKQSATPANPAATFDKLYFKSDDKLYRLNSAGTEVQLFDNALTSAHIFVGNGSNVATDVALSGDLSILNTGAATVATVGGSSAANVNAATVLANAATNANTASAIVRRDASGNFSAGTITASLTGNATNVTGIVASANGGTGVNNAGSLTYGANNITLTTSGVTSLTLPTSGTVATLAGVESFSNKTYSDAITMTQIATPSSPGASKDKMYFKSDDKLYGLNSAGTEVLIGPSAGGTGPRSDVKVDGGNGYGSTNTVIRRYSNIVTNLGTDITYADSATLGASFTINTTGVYSMGTNDENSGGTCIFGFSVNSAQLSTNIDGITSANRLGLIQSASSINGTVSATAVLTAGDVVRPHGRGTCAATAPAFSAFRITKVSN